MWFKVNSQNQRLLCEIAESIYSCLICCLVHKTVQLILIFLGPLIPGRTHKGEVIQFCQTKISSAKRNHQVNQVFC